MNKMLDRVGLTIMVVRFIAFAVCVGVVLGYSWAGAVVILDGSALGGLMAWAVAGIYGYGAWWILGARLYEEFA